MEEADKGSRGATSNEGHGEGDGATGDGRRATGRPLGERFACCVLRGREPEAKGLSQSQAKGGGGFWVNKEEKDEGCDRNEEGGVVDAW